VGVIEKTEKKVFLYIEENGMISPDDRIVAGVSGGADSVCLFYLLLEYAKRVPLSLAVVHVNHGIRPEAGEDEGYVEELCRREGISFFPVAADVHRLAAEAKCSEEDMGRRIRYEAFCRTAKTLGGARIAVAHNGNDNAETILFHLFRGSGLKGLGGIAPVREEGSERIIRPILCLERREVEAYLRERGISWRTDSTNDADGYCRNRIRHHVLPYAEQEISQGAVRHMCQTAELLRETETFLEQQTAQALERCVMAGPSLTPHTGSGEGTAVRDDCFVINAEAFLSVHEVLQKRMLLALLKKLSPTGKDISQVHIRDTRTLFSVQANRTIHLPYGIIAWRQYENVLIGRESQLLAMSFCATGADAVPWEGWFIPVPSAEKMQEDSFVCLVEGRKKIAFTLFSEGKFFPGKFSPGKFSFGKGQKVPENRYTKWFDYDRIEEPLVVRTRRSGDFFTIADGTGKLRHKSLKDYMITEKIPGQIRDAIPVLASGSHILWLMGWRISEYFKVDENTKRVLQVELLASETVG